MMQLFWGFILANTELLIAFFFSFLDRERVVGELQFI